MKKLFLLIRNWFKNINKDKEYDKEFDEFIKEHE